MDGDPQHLFLVSILSPPEGRLQPGVIINDALYDTRFQSSAHPKAGCNPQGQGTVTRPGGFQSSAHPKAGCNAPVT
ncbi:hypothetical protein DAERI_050249 [Deinococcus aerius]|uniref:Uncharacterized protein n=1 Tax=Deinococcus aerius TaxID=200253 RepID=A0A2I9D5R5_9DEIO|nr:hypothetical protein [Deinococcus aerius]GBF05740.1 hypothetical protein DAERI_050249 [Deinococcus aerius]